MGFPLLNYPTGWRACREQQVIPAIRARARCVGSRPHRFAPDMHNVRRSPSGHTLRSIRARRECQMAVRARGMCRAIVLRASAWQPRALRQPDSCQPEMYAAVRDRVLPPVRGSASQFTRLWRRKLVRLAPAFGPGLDLVKGDAHARAFELGEAACVFLKGLG